MKVLMMFLLCEAKFEGNFQVKRGGQEPFRPFQLNQLLANMKSRKQQSERITMTQKIQNRKLRQLLHMMTGNAKMNHTQEKRRSFRINRFQKFHQN